MNTNKYYTIDNSSPFAAKLVEAEHKRVVIRDNLIAEQNAKRTKIRYNSGVSHLNSQLAMTNEKHGTTLTRADLEQALNETKGGKGTNFQKLKRYYAAKGINFGNQRESIIKYAWFDTLDNILNYENKGKSQEEESIFNEKESLNKDTVDNWMNLSRQNLSINNLLAQSNNYQSNSLRIANKDISKKESPLSIAGSQPATKTSPT